MTVGSDGALWFTSLTGIYRVTTSGTVTEYTGADSSDPGAIISTPAGKPVVHGPILQRHRDLQPGQLNLQDQPQAV